MSARLEIGSHGEITTTPQRRVDGKWKSVEGNQVRSAERWRARATLRGHDGMTRDVTRVASTRKAAVAAVDVALAEFTRGSGSGAIRPATPFVTVAELWLVEIERPEARLSASTKRTYSDAVARYIDVKGSPIRGLSLTQVNSPARIRGLLQKIADEHGTATARTTKTVISSILNFCVSDGVIEVNAARQVRPVVSAALPKAEARPRDTSRAFTAKERDDVIAFADTAARDDALDPRTTRKRQAVADLVAFMGGTGARIGEARGLRWEHVATDFTYVRLHGTKSRSARRRLDLPPWLAARMSQRVLTLQDSYRGAAKNAKATDTQTRSEVVAGFHAAADAVGVSGYVFPSPAHADGEKAWDQSNSSNAVREVLDAAGFTWATGHTFRRTVATRLGEAGTPLARIADQLGHADPAMTASVYLGRDFEGDKSDLAAHL